MFGAVKRTLEDLKRGQPGQRFKQHHERAQRSKSGRGARRWVNLLLALLAFAIGVVLVFIPGPAVLFFFLAGALLAPESRAIARFMDWAEVKIRAVWHWVTAHWRRLSHAGKIAAGSVIAMGGVAGAFAFWRILRG